MRKTVFRYAKLELALQKKYGNIFNAEIRPDHKIIFSLKPELGDYKENHLELPNKEEVKELVSKKLKIDINNIDVTTILYNREFENEIKIDGNGENLILDCCKFRGNLKVEDVNILTFDGLDPNNRPLLYPVNDRVYVAGNLDANANRILSNNCNITCFGSAKLNAGVISLMGGQLDFRKQEYEMNSEKSVSLLNINFKNNKANLKLNSNKVNLSSTYLRLNNLNINSNELYLYDNNINVENNAYINSDRIDSENNGIISNFLTVNNRRNDGIDSVSANTIIYNNEDVTYKADRKLVAARKKLIKTLKKLKGECNSIKSSTINEKMEELDKELNSTQVQKILNKK